MCGLTQDGLTRAWEVYSSAVNDKYVGGGGLVSIRRCSSARAAGKSLMSLFALVANKTIEFDQVTSSEPPR